VQGMSQNFVTNNYIDYINFVKDYIECIF
jgi:hypothetical protein